MAPKPQFRDLGQQFFEEQEDYDEGDDTGSGNGDIDNLNVNLGNPGNLGNPLGGGSGPGGSNLGGINPQIVGGSSGGAGFGGFGKLGGINSGTGFSVLGSLGGTNPQIVGGLSGGTGPGNLGNSAGNLGNISGGIGSNASGFGSLGILGGKAGRGFGGGAGRGISNLSGTSGGVGGIGSNTDTGTSRNTGRGSRGGRGGRGSIGGIANFGGLKITNEGQAQNERGGGRTTDEALVKVVESISNNQKNIAELVSKQFTELQGVCEQIVERINTVAATKIVDDQDTAADALDTLTNNIDNRMSPDNAYIIIKGQEERVVTFDKLSDIIGNKTIHICSGVQSVAASLVGDN